jgi:SAM-dependent methyltransferase
MFKYYINKLIDFLRDLKRETGKWGRYWNEFEKYKHLSGRNNDELFPALYPCIHDYISVTPIEPTYFYQDAWAFELIVKRKPESHVDVGSHHKFVALLSKVVPLTMVDIRPLELPLNTIAFREGSILELPFGDNSIASLSCLCVVEHIGLGRYNDPLDAWGSAKAIQELKRVLAHQGRLYLSVPIGEQNVVAFNAGRIFTLKYIQELIKPLEIVEQKFIVGCSFQNDYEARPRFGTTGLFELTKP